MCLGACAIAAPVAQAHGGHGTGSAKAGTKVHKDRPGHISLPDKNMARLAPPSPALSGGSSPGSGKRLRLDQIRALELAAQPTGREIQDLLDTRLKHLGAEGHRTGVSGDTMGKYLAGLGPDAFDLRRPDPPRVWAKGFPWKKLTDGQVSRLLRMISMTEPEPTAEQVRSIKADPGSVITENGRTAPKIWKFIWVGDPLQEDRTTDGKPGPMSEIRDNLARFAKEYGGEIPLVLFVDRKREDYARVKDASGDDLSYFESGLRSEYAWAKKHNIALVDYFEVFNEENPGALHPFIRAEQADPTGEGKATQADWTKGELQYLFGGGLSDVDNLIKAGLREDMRSALKSPDGFGRDKDSNTIYFGPAKLPYFKAFLDAVPGTYELDVAGLYPTGHKGLKRPSPAHEPWDWTQRHILRREVVWHRVGRALAAAAKHMHEPFTDWKSITVKSAGTWRPPRTTRNIYMKREETERLAVQLASTMIRESYFLNGTLDLFRLDTAIRKHKHPELLYNGVLGFLQKNFRSRFRAVADAGYDDAHTQHVVKLPKASRELFEVDPDRNRDDWLLGRRVLSATFKEHVYPPSSGASTPMTPDTPGTPVSPGTPSKWVERFQPLGPDPDWEQPKRDWNSEHWQVIQKGRGQMVIATLR